MALYGSLSLGEEVRNGRGASPPTLYADRCFPVEDGIPEPGACVAL